MTQTEIVQPHLSKQSLENLDVSILTPTSPEVISRQATINIGTIGHVAHGKSTVVKALTGVLTVRFRNERERNITIKLGYANAKVNYFFKNLKIMFIIFTIRFINVTMNNAQDQVAIGQLVAVRMMNFHAIDLAVAENTIY